MALASASTGQAADSDVSPTAWTPPRSSEHNPVFFGEDPAQKEAPNDETVREEISLGSNHNHPQAASTLRNVDLDSGDSAGSPVREDSHNSNLSNQCQPVTTQSGQDSHHSGHSSPSSPAHQSGPRDAALSEEPPPDSDVPSKVEEYMDWALEYAGSWGPFQHRSCLISFATNALTGIQTMCHIFVSMPPELRSVCTRGEAHCGGERDTHIFEKQDCALSPEEYEWVDSAHSITSEFGLICDSAFKEPILGTLFFLGYLVGVSVFGNICDKKGRRPAFLWSLCIVQIGAIMSVLSPQYLSYAAARVIIGFGVGGLGLSSYVWNAEIVGQAKLPLLVIIQCGGFACGTLLLSPLAMSVSNWRMFLLACFFLGMPLLMVQQHIVESPKWLAGPAGRLEEARAVLDEIALTNERSSPPPPSLARVSTNTAPDAGLKDDEQSVLQALLCDGRLTWRFLVMCAAWFALSLGYYGLSMNAKNIGLSVYVSSAILAMVELPTYPVAMWAIEAARAGRKGVVGGCLVFGGTCCLISAMAANTAAILMTCAFIGKAAIAAAFGVVYLFAAELFPTTIRSSSMSLQSVLARVGAMVAPIVADMGKVSKSLPFWIFGMPCLFAGLLVLTLPETAGKPMPGKMDDIEVSAGGGFCPFGRYDEFKDDDNLDSGMPSPTTYGGNKI